MTADIEKAFLNVAISPEHRDYLRFLWINDPSSEAPHIQVLRFTRVVFGLTSSPFILNATLKHHVTQYANVDPDFVNEVMRSLYVDDFASGSRDVKSALQLSTKVKNRLADGGFNMRKWTSNSQELMAELQKNATFSKSKQSINTDKSTATTLKATNGDQLIPESNPRVLGQIWNTSTDQVKIDLTKILTGGKSQQRDEENYSQYNSEVLRSVRTYLSNCTDVQTTFSTIMQVGLELVPDCK